MREEVRRKSERKTLKKKLCNSLVRKRIVINSIKIRKSAPNINQPTDNSLSETREKWKREIFKEMTQRIPVFIMAAAAAKSLQSCPTLCDPIDGSPPGSPNPWIVQARTLEWVAISFSNAWKWKGKVKLLSRVLLLATPWTAAYQAPLSLAFARQEYRSGLPLPSPFYHGSLYQPAHWG